MGGCFCVSLSCGESVLSVVVSQEELYSQPHRESCFSAEIHGRAKEAKRDDDGEARVNREEFTGSCRRLSQIQVWLTSILTPNHRRPI
ncbi:hypothetical protein F2Q69_00026540 [Brassica cretica]|uniref:Uncharacterized protein n=1 Tax=Brassica cretica TaxID=69181 RepID=A0A8S9RRG0_BRACR|nr:hypothetical protein F2Q69_00026540 [Brassica cretica]